MDICSSKINQGIQQETGPTCSATNCNARCNQACNGLTNNQTCHAKSCGCTFTWKCPQHGTGIAKIIILPPPVYELPICPSAAGKLCSVCKNPIRSRYADLAYHCADPSCDNVCHFAATCSGFVNPRGPTRACTLSTRIWYCHLHSSTTASGHSSTQSDTSPTCPSRSSLNSLLNQGMSLAGTKNSKENCAKCLAALRSNTVPVRCNVCKKGLHQKYSTGLKALTCDDLRNCEKCIKLQQNRSAASTNCQLPDPTNSIPLQPLPVVVRSKLKILQWNADGIHPKFVELCDRLINSDIGIWLFKN